MMLEGPPLQEGGNVNSASNVAGRPERTEEERAYYALNAWAWPLFAPFYDLVVAPFRKIRAFAQRSRAVVGVDLCEEMLRIAVRKRAAENLTYQQADATALPFPDRSFQVSCVSFALHEMPRRIRDRALAEMVRVTVPQGTIVIVDYAPPRGTVESDRATREAL